MKKKLNVIFTSHPDYSGNTKALYEYIKVHEKNMNLYWVIFDHSNYDLMSSNNINVVTYGTKKFKEVFDNTDVIFFDHDELIELKKENQIYIYLGHGYACKKFGYFLSEENLAMGDKKYLELMRSNIDYIICASELWKILYKIAFDFEYNRILTLGSPRTDYIYNKYSKDKLELVSKRNINDYDNVIMYLPTFRSGLGREADGGFTDNIFNIDKYKEDELDDYLKKNNYLLVIKHHPYEKNKDNKFESNNIVYLDDEYMTKKNITLAEIISASDLIVADYSSAHSDALILDKPVCFLQNDIDLYKKNRGIFLDDTDIWFPGPYIKNLKDLKCEIKKLLSNKNYYSKERKEYVDMMFGKNIKNNAKRIYEYLFKSDFDLFEKKPKIVDKEKIDLYNENIKLKLNFYENEILSLNHNLTEELELLRKQNQDLSSKLLDSYNKLDIIYNSKGWKLLENLRSILRSIKKKNK